VQQSGADNRVRRMGDGEVVPAGCTGHFAPMEHPPLALRWQAQQGAWPGCRVLVGHPTFDSATTPRGSSRFRAFCRCQAQHGEARSFLPPAHRPKLRAQDCELLCVLKRPVAADSPAAFVLCRRPPAVAWLWGGLIGMALGGPLKDEIGAHLEQLFASFSEGFGKGPVHWHSPPWPGLVLIRRDRPPVGPSA